MDKETATESLAEPLQALGQDWCNGCLSLTRSLADVTMTPRQRYEAGCATMEKLTRDVLALEEQWVRAVEQSTPSVDGGDASNLLAMGNHVACEMVAEGIRMREQLWEMAFRELRSAENLIPDSNGLANANPDAWQALFNSWLGEGRKQG
ncbi:MAG: hypothetical protein JJU06_16920 [Ectothiorhodospiraceae bacterium]|nr:hypothetical protein [Ectothiorhodospiraceae bacterium]MCH8503967.1 hypothetical protein [Ectothiorhodospiraceae bacterium]